MFSSMAVLEEKLFYKVVTIAMFWTIRSCFLLTLTFLSFYSLLLYFTC